MATDHQAPPAGGENQAPFLREAGTYAHGDQAVQRPAVGVQQEFPDRRPPKDYRYDSSLAPELCWDENAARDQAEWLLTLIERAATQGEEAVFATPQVWAGTGEVFDSLPACVARLKSLTRPFLNWAGKAERHRFRLHTLPLFVHERLSTQAILSTLETYKAVGTTQDMFGDPGLDIADQLDAYDHLGPWSNRLILGDSLQVMNSLLEYEGLGGQVQMIYMDPPYGVKYGSNFQPFVRKREVKHGQDGDMIREPEMVKAYRDTWELGLHSYLTYLRDRLLLARELLKESGSIFLQISDDNVHHVLEVMDEVFGNNNRVSIIAFKKTGFASSTGLAVTHDFIIWYAKNHTLLKFNQIFAKRDLTSDELAFHDHIEEESGHRRPLTKEEIESGSSVRQIGKPYARNPLISDGWQDSLGFVFDFKGLQFRPPRNCHWKTHLNGMNSLREANCLAIKGNTLRFVRFFDDFPLQPLGTVWNDTGIGGVVGEQRLYVVQTDVRVIQRCLLMTTDPGDLILDPTCGGGTTAYVAEHWGRRWITCDTSRVPLALTRQRLLTATFPWYQLKEPGRGPAGGFVYERRRNRKGEEVGGLVPRITLKSIANDEEPETITLVDRPEVNARITRVCGRFTVEATVQAARTVDDPPPAEGEAPERARTAEDTGPTKIPAAISTA